MRLTPLLAAAAALVLMQAGRPAQAGLIGNGTNTVSALFFARDGRSQPALYKSASHGD